MFIHIDHFLPLAYTCPPPLGLEARHHRLLFHRSPHSALPLR